MRSQLKAYYCFVWSEAGEVLPGGHQQVAICHQERTHEGQGAHGQVQHLPVDPAYVSRRVYTSANDAVCRVLPYFAAAITAWQ